LATHVITIFNVGDVVAMIHTHPKSTQSDPLGADITNRQNRAPSDGDFDVIENPGSALDLEELVILAGVDVNVWRSNFSHYIIDTDGKLREFDNTESNSGTILYNGTTYPKNNYYDVEPFFGSFQQVISKLWASFTLFDAQGRC